MALDDDAFSRALLMAGLGMIGQRNVWDGLARGGMFGVQGYDQAVDRKRRMASDDIASKMQAIQLANAQQAQADQQAERALASRAFAPGVQPLVPNDDNGNPMPTGGGGGLPEYAKGLFAINPKDAIALQQSLAKETPFGKIDPKDYTAESVRAFAATGGRDFSVLQPRSKVEVSNGLAYDPYATKAGTVLTGPLSDVVSDGKGGYTFNPAKINPMERARVGIEQAGLGLRRAEFNRGVFSTSVPLPDGNTGAGFVTPAGFKQAAGTGEKNDMPASLREALATNNVTLAKIDGALAGIDQYPQALGAKNYLGDAVRQRTDSQGVDVRAAVADIGSQKIHDRSGSAVTISEAPRLLPFVPAVTDTPEVAKKKLARLRNEYALMQQELSGGRSIQQVAGIASQDGKMPSMAEIQAERMKRGKGQ